MEYILLSEVKEAKYNPRTITAEELNKLKASLKKFGCVRPLVINTITGVLVSGHQTLKAARELKLEQLPVIYISVDEDEEKRLNLALNRISGEFDNDKLSKLFLELGNGQFTGFSDNEIKEIQVDYNYDDLSKQMNELNLAEMDSFLWAARFSKQEDFKEVKQVIDYVKTKLKIGQFKGENANGKALKVMCEEILDSKQNARMLNAICRVYKENDKKMLR